MRILVTGSRDWDDRIVIEQALLPYLPSMPSTPEPPPRNTLVHGACPTGADRIADIVGRFGGLIVEPHPADWRPGGVFDRSAGFKRNAEMVELGADLCLAFIRNGSKGATHTADLAEKAGIPVRRFTQEA